jgi:hypothetical protein
MRIIKRNNRIDIPLIFGFIIFKFYLKETNLEYIDYS